MQYLVLVWYFEYCIRKIVSNTSFSKPTHCLLWDNFVKTGVRVEEETPAKKVRSRISFYFRIPGLSFRKTSLLENTKEVLVSHN